MPMGVGEGRGRLPGACALPPADSPLHRLLSGDKLVSIELDISDSGIWTQAATRSRRTVGSDTLRERAPGVRSASRAVPILTTASRPVPRRHCGSKVQAGGQSPGVPQTGPRSRSEVRFPPRSRMPRRPLTTKPRELQNRTSQPRSGTTTGCPRIKWPAQVARAGGPSAGMPVGAQRRRSAPTPPWKESMPSRLASPG